MIKVTFCSVDKKKYKIDIPQGSSIGQVKQIYEREIGDCDSGTMKMIFKKRILSNDVLIDSLNLTEKDNIVVFVSNKASIKTQSKSTTQSGTSSASNNDKIAKTSQINESQPITDTNLQPISQSVNNLPNSNPIPLYNPNQQNTSPSQTPSYLPQAAPYNPNQSVNNFPNSNPIPLYNPNQQNAAQSQTPSYLPQITPYNLSQLMQFPFLYNQSNTNSPFYPTTPTTTATTLIQENKEYMNDPSFHRKLDYLMQIGDYDRSTCINALRAAFGNVERATEYLIRGHIPQVHSSSSSASSCQESLQLDQEFITTFRQMLLIEPQLLENFIEEFEIKRPSLRQNPEMLLNEFGLSTDGFDIEGIKNYSIKRVDPKRFDQLLNQVRSQVCCPNLMECIDDYQSKKRSKKEEERRNEDSMLSQFSEEEKEQIRRIQSLGNFSLNEVIQIYLACEKNEQLTANLLLYQK